MKSMELTKKIESTLLVLQESAEHGNMDPEVFADVLEIVLEKVEQLSTLLSTDGRAVA